MGNSTNDNAPTGGCPMIQEAVRELNKKQAAAQSKKAGSTRKDTHPGDNHLMMSQNKKGCKDKRSGYTLQRSMSTTVRASGSSAPEPSDDLIVRNSGSDISIARKSGSDILKFSEDLFGSTDESSPDLPSPIAFPPDRASRECRTLNITTSALNRHDATPGESTLHNSDGSESDRNPRAHDSGDSGGETHIPEGSTWMTAQPDMTGLTGVNPALGENRLHALEDAPDASSNHDKPPPLAEHCISPSQDDASSSDSYSDLPALEGNAPELRPSDADFERLFASPTPTAADIKRT
jgi:hypothetical protein